MATDETTTDDMTLLGEYARNNSEEAFAALVSRYINLVYSVTLRQVGNAHLAEEITQVVFIILARKAGSLSSKTILPGWLCRTARYASANALTIQRRQQRREQEAHMQSLLNETESDAWQQIAPLLDGAMAQLGEKDHDAIVLRFFDGRNLKDVGLALGTSEDAAKKRVNRAVEKLRKFFTKRGVVSTTAMISGVVSANSVQAAPATLATSISAVAITKGATATCSALTLVKGTLKLMAWAKIKTATVVIVISLFMVGVGGAFYNRDTNSNMPVKNEVILIVPGESVGKIKGGMTREQVIAELGEPERTQGTIMVYDKRLGLSVAPRKTGGIAAIFCGDSAPDYPNVGVFKGRTKEGIGMKSTRAELIAAFGEPTKKESFGPKQEQLEYQPLGLIFILEDGKVFHITVNFRKTN